MAMRRAVSIAAAAALAFSLACGETEGCGVLDADYEYPRTDPQAQVTPETARVRITEAGFDTLASGVGGIMRAACEANPADGSEACAVHGCEGCAGFAIGQGEERLNGRQLALRILFVNGRDFQYA